MSLKDIIERFALVSGLDMEDVSRFLPLLDDCREFFESRMADGLSDADIRRAANACAAYAFYRVTLLGRMDDLSSFKVGDVQMNIKAAGEAAEKLWAAERESVSDIVDIGGEFAFRSVRV